MSFEDERSLLLRWRDLVLEADPDILIGYNIVNFDLPYLLNRAETLKIPQFWTWGRLRHRCSRAVVMLHCASRVHRSRHISAGGGGGGGGGGRPRHASTSGSQHLTCRKCRMRDARFSSKAYGTHDFKEITIEGRVQFDLLQAIQRDHKLSSYSLNSVSAHFLGEQKEDVHHSDISKLQDGNAESRRRLAIYCLKVGASCVGWNRLAWNCRHDTLCRCGAPLPCRTHIYRSAWSTNSCTCTTMWRWPA